MNISPNISELPLLGPASERMLKKAGIESADHLKRLGAIEAFFLVKQQSNPSKNLLYALHGALHGLSWREASAPELRAQLQMELEAFEETFSELS